MAVFLGRTKRNERDHSMSENNRHLSGKGRERSSRHTPFRMMDPADRFSCRLISLLIYCIILIALPLSALFQFPGTDAFLGCVHAFEVHHDTGPLRDAYQSTISLNDDLSAEGETEIKDSRDYRFHEGTAPSPTFGANPSPLLSTRNIDSPHDHLFSESVFYTDGNLKCGEENNMYAEDRYETLRHLLVFTPHTHSESTFQQYDVLFPYEQKPDVRPHDTLQELIIDYSERPTEPIQQRSADNMVTYPPGQERGKYSLCRDSKSHYGGNVKLSLSFPWLRKNTDRSFLLPDSIYVGTEIDYFTIAENLQSWKSGNSTWSADLSRFGSEWFDTRSGYIHFEWRLGK